MGNKNDYFCCSAAETHPSAIYDIDSLVFRHLDFNKAETYKKLEKVAQEFTTSKPRFIQRKALQRNSCRW
jgi:hypothetical protein